MSDPTKDQAPKDDLDLDKETVRDLEPEENDVEDVRGGRPLLKATALSACRACG